MANHLHWGHQKSDHKRGPAQKMHTCWQPRHPTELRGNLAVDGRPVAVLDQPLRSEALWWCLRYPSALAEQLMTDINPSFDAPCHITWQRIVNNTPSWLNARALFDRSQQVEFNRQQKCHATLNDLEQATEHLYECSLEAEAQCDERRAKAEADSMQLPLEQQLA